MDFEGSKQVLRNEGNIESLSKLVEVLSARQDVIARKLDLDWEEEAKKLEEQEKEDKED